MSYRNRRDRLDQPWTMVREQRARMLANAVARVLDDYVPRDCRSRVNDRLLEFFFDLGAEIVTDADRERAGLPPRGDHGLTAIELRILEVMRLDRLTKPQPVVLPT